MTLSETIDKKIGETLEAMKKSLEIGDFVTEFSLYDEQGRPFNSADDYLNGRPLVFVFAPAKVSDVALEELKKFAALAEEFEKYGVAAVLMSLDPDNKALAQLKQKTAWPGPAVADPTGRVFALYGVVAGDEKPGLRTIVTTARRRVSAIFDLGAHAGHAKRALETVLRASAAEEDFIAGHAPVLIVPNVFNEQECRELVAYYERESHPVDFNKSNPETRNVDTKTPVWEHNRQDRIDLAVKHPATVQILDRRIFERVAPQIKKVFGYMINKRESINIARYEGTRSGVEMGHRDNVHADVTHRRFALSIALNDDYEGGELVFREFSEHPYRLKAGSALVFSSSLLHEVLETTRGRRYVIISHLFSDVAQR